MTGQRITLSDIPEAGARSHTSWAGTGGSAPTLHHTSQPRERNGLNMTAITDSRAAQRQAALAAGNDIRMTIAAWRRESEQHSQQAVALRVTGLLLAPDPGKLAAIRIGHLLRTIPLVGALKARYFCRRAGVMSVDAQLRDLTIRQREALACTVTEAYGDRS